MSVKPPFSNDDEVDDAFQSPNDNNHHGKA